jgi:lipopolysaccharide/colanic/teichoic acid biosynthesis glycosyltransferase
MGGMARDIAMDPPLAGTQRRESLAYFVTKRMIDIFLAASILVIFSPLLLAIAFAIKVDSPGPVFFTQERLGGRRRGLGSVTWHVEPFRLAKFRTMHVDADVGLHRTYMSAYIKGDTRAVDALRSSEATFKLTTDPRVTRLGRRLRKLSLDELPQLWNVVRGEMSLVGPRPPIPYEVEHYRDVHLTRLACTPGMTGLAQVHGRGNLDFEATVHLDLDYIDRRSTWLDLSILLRTVPVVVTGRGAG